VTPDAGVPVPQLPFPSHAPALHGVPTIAGAHCPELALHWLETHSVPPQWGVPVHAPARHVSELAKTHSLPSLHVVPSGAVGFEHWPLVGSHAPAVWQVPGAAHVTGFEPTHAPAVHASVCVHALPSLHVVPSAAFGFEHVPVDGLHVPTAWHWSAATQTTGLAPVHVPLSHVSVCVQALPSLQVVPFAAAGFEHVPVNGLHVPTAWHWSDAVHVTGFAPVHVPLSHASVCVHALPSLHVVPFAAAGFEHCPVDELHVPAA